MDSRMVRHFDARKFMWDGDPYATQADADRKRHEYLARGFKVKIVTDGDAYLVYTRRVVPQGGSDGS